MAKLKNTRSVQARGAWYAAFAAVALAVTDIAAPNVYAAGGNPVTLLMLRALATISVIGVVLIFTGRMKSLNLADEIKCVISGLLFMFAGLGLFSALAILPVSTVVLLLYMFPILTTIFDAIARREIPSALTIALLIVALSGLALALDVTGARFDTEGVFFGLLAAVSAATTFVWNNHKLGKLDPEQITFRMFCVSFVIFSGWLIIADNFALPQSSEGSIWLAVMLACFAFAFLGMFRGAQMAGSVRASMIMNLEPVVAILLAVVFLNETMKPTQVLGAVLVLAAVLVSQLRAKT